MEIMTSEYNRILKRPLEDESLEPVKHKKIGNEVETLEGKYTKMHSIYMNEGLPQQTQLFLRRIAKSFDLPPELKQMPILRMITEIAIDLLLNDLEISL